VRRRDAPGRWAVRHRKLDAPYGLDRKASWTDPEMIRFIAVKDELTPIIPAAWTPNTALSDRSSAA